ncbi:hypothetical protein BU23DRAFT_297875 [Bimuria novae-zelandiae CBS 107.79]|uniref:Uncharacterized protein n=1 Tax=Bimuria novae-zelandiae CBS 107.79 TaxID=1447943 RepID=A0A6A5VWA8_9PLEO|nr:hypothetical protein BU23DRAFT_297875 [Bimuria novae-zelandiae CBS 107.79]
MREHTSNDDMKSEIHEAFRLLSDLGRRSETTAYLYGFKYKTFHCPFCPTEVVLEFIPHSLYTDKLSKRHRKRQFVFSITRYVGMGHLLDLEELEWRALTTFYKHPGVEWSQLPQSARLQEQNVPREEWSCIDLTHMEPISVRFERTLSIRPGWKPFCDTPLRERPHFAHAD